MHHTTTKLSFLPPPQNKYNWNLQRWIWTSIHTTHISTTTECYLIENLRTSNEKKKLSFLFCFFQLKFWIIHIISHHMVIISYIIDSPFPSPPFIPFAFTHLHKSSTHITSSWIIHSFFVLFWSIKFTFVFHSLILIYHICITQYTLHTMRE